MFSKKVVVITGASSGIGAATAQLFADQSADLSIVGRNADNLKAVADKCKEKGANVLEIIADISIDEDIKRIVDETIKKFGKIDVLVNNAGFGTLGTIDNVELLDKMFATNLRGVYKLTGLFAPHLFETKGNIINISSIFAKKPFPLNTAYCVCKAGLDMFTRCAALEYGPKGVRVNGINPGNTKTRFLNRLGLSDDHVKGIENNVEGKVLLGKLVESEEVGELIMFLASEKARSITGTNNVIDNGDLVTVA